MRCTRVAAWLAVLWMTAASLANAQSTTGTISGRVTDDQNLPVPGVTVNVESPSLQGIRSVISSENGDYIVSLLPPGVYTVAFELSGFRNVRRVVSLATTQSLPLNVSLGPAEISETVDVVGRSADVLTHTAQVATNFSQELMSVLPTARDVRSVMFLSPGVHSSGALGFFSVGGAMSHENLYMVNGVAINENLNGQPLLLSVEDAVQETTVATAGISAEYGRFSGGIVNVITKSGGNLFSGSFREGLTNDDWRALVPSRAGDVFTTDSKIDKVVPTHEFTLGGPVLRDRLWFFAAGLLQEQEASRQTIATNIPFTFSDQMRRLEGKVTYSLDSNHRFQGAFTKLTRNLLNNTNFNVLDLNSLENRKEPADLVTVSYSGVMTPSFFIEGRYSHRNLTFDGSGSRATDPINGTLLVDSATNRRYWSATFCGVCPPDQRDNEDFFVKSSYFLSTKGYGSHNVVAGYDNFNDIRYVSSHQSGSDFRFTNAPAIVRGTDVYPQFRSGSTIIQWNPIFIESQGTDFRTHSLFLNDNWRVNGNLTANVGVRWDKNQGVDSNGVLVARDSALSPRFGLIWDPNADGKWSVTGSTAKYVAGISNRLADATSPAGLSDSYQFLYRGPSINADASGALTPTADAIAQVFQWFDAAGGVNLPISGGTPNVRGVSTQVLGSLKSPSVWEYAGGVSRQFGARAALRVDYVFRNFQDFYVARADTTTGRVIDQRSYAHPAVQGRQYDLAILENDTEGRLRRRYSSVTTQGQYRFGTRLDVGGNYTLSRLWGNVDGETGLLGGISTDAAMAYQYPEYREARWNYPDGNLLADQRHRARL